MKDLIIFGSRGFGHKVAWAVKPINKVPPIWNLLGFMDDDKSIQGSVINSYKVLGKTGNIGKYSDACIMFVQLALQGFERRYLIT